MKTIKYKLDNVFQYSTYIVLALIFLVFSIGSDKFFYPKKYVYNNL